MCVGWYGVHQTGRTSMEITEEQFNELIARLAMIYATGKTNGKARLGMAGAVEAFETIQEFIEELGEQA